MRMGVGRDQPSIVSNMKSSTKTVGEFQVSLVEGSGGVHDVGLLVGSGGVHGDIHNHEVVIYQVIFQVIYQVIYQVVIIYLSSKPDGK